MDIKEAEDLIQQEKSKRETECHQSIMAVLAKYSCNMFVATITITPDGKFVPNIAIACK